MDPATYKEQGHHWKAGSGLTWDTHDCQYLKLWNKYIISIVDIIWVEFSVIYNDKAAH